MSRFRSCFCYNCRRHYSAEDCNAFRLHESGDCVLACPHGYLPATADQCEACNPPVSAHEHNLAQLEAIESGADHRPTPSRPSRPS